MNLKENQWVESIKKSKNSRILDVRTPEEYECGFIENSINLNIYDSHIFMEGIKEFEKSDYIHIYCRSGRRSFQACELMKQIGFENVFNLEDGILDWKGNIVNVN